MRKRRPTASFLIALALATSALLVGALPAAADAPPGPYFNGFETNTSGWFDKTNGWVGTIARQQSGDPSGGYANGIASASDGYHARVSGDPCAPPVNCTGPFTRWGGYNQTFPNGGYRTYLAIYLDTGWAASHPDARFDWLSVINDPTGTHLRDFAFNASTNPTAGSPGGFVINASTNSTRSGANPNAPCPSPSSTPNTCRVAVHITTAGWYTFRHTFRNDGNFLAVDFAILPSGSNTAVPGGSWTIKTGDCFAPCVPGPTFGFVGANRSGWFSNEEIPELAIDDSQRTGLTMALAPATATNVVGSSHTVTASTTSTEPPYPSPGAGVVVEFDVTTGPNQGQSSHLPPNGGCSPSGCTTDSSGMVSWTYTSNGAAGTDTIEACFAERPPTVIRPLDDPRTCVTATKTWQSSTTGKVTGGGQVGSDPVFAASGALLSLPALVPSAANPSAQASFGFVVQAGSPPSGNLEYNDKPADVRIKAISYSGLGITSGPCGPNSRSAVFAGSAEVTRLGVTTTENFTVRVDDCGEPGTADTFRISTTGYSNGSTLIGGNIQIHK
jgi:hypothetical protein